MGEVALVREGMIDMAIDGVSVLGDEPQVRRVREIRDDTWLEPVVASRSSRIRDRYEGLVLEFESGTSVEFRAYEDGAAYRFVTSATGEVEVNAETIDLSFPEGTRSFFPEEDDTMSHYERFYKEIDLGVIEAGRLCSLPVMIDPPGEARMVVSEADLYDYPALFLRAGEGPTLEALHPRVVLEVKPTGDRPDRTEEIVREADYIAKTDGTRSFPWRIFIIGKNDGVFLENDLVFQLSRPLEIEDPSWIKPGKVAWDWYNANNLTGVDFRSGLNTETYLHYIDFAAEYGLEYVILDEGWSATTLEVDRPAEEIDLARLIEHGKARGVGIILWTLWKPIAEDGERLFALYHEWGVKGVKIDFMQRSDQEMVNFYLETAKVAARHQLLLDYHSSFKPSGLRRAYPNVLTYEGVKGSENQKWGQRITPTHNVTIPYIRMAVGPIDYTPGAMSNAHLVNHVASYDRPMSIGTRAHEVAKFVVFESPLQMLCDTPSAYRKEEETTRFIARIPAVWDETRFLAGEVGEYIAVARRLGDTWYVGAMTNDEERTILIDWSFLPDGDYRIEIFADGINADRHAEDYRLRALELDRSRAKQAELAPDGGWSAIITRQ